MMVVDRLKSDSLLLPSQFFIEGSDIPSSRSKPINQNWSSCSGSSDFGSNLSSPVESELASTESESDPDDDHIAEMIRHMAHYMLQDGDNKHQKITGVADSPQGTLWSPFSSNLEEVFIMGKSDNLKIKINEEVQNNNSNERFSGYSLRPSLAPLTAKNTKSSIVEIHSKQVLIDEQIRAIHFYKLKQEQIMKQQRGSQRGGKQPNRYNQNEPKPHVRQFQSRGRACGGFSNGEKGCSLQPTQSTGSEMKVVSPGESGSRSGPSGTGVFLPQGIANVSESRNKRGCPTVLIPARVVRALKLPFDKIGGGASRSRTISFPLQHDPMNGDVWYGVQLHHQNKFRPVPATNHEQDTGLPQEWTY